MFCTHCGSRLPEQGAKFCPQCGSPVAAPAFEEAIETFETAPETPNETVEAAVETFETAPETPSETVEAAVETFETAPETPKEPVRPVPPVQAAPTVPARKGMHFTATLAIVLTAVAFVLSTFALIAVVSKMAVGLMIALSVFALVATPIAFGFGVAAFIIGLKNRHPATWIIGLIAGVVSILICVFTFFYLVFGVLIAVV